MESNSYSKLVDFFVQQLTVSDLIFQKVSSFALYTNKNINQMSDSL